MTDHKASKLPGDDAQVNELLESSEEAPSLEEESEAAARRHRTIQGNDVLLRLHQAGKGEKPPTLPADGGETDLTDMVDLAIREYTVERDSNLPLQFAGYLVGWNDIDTSVPRGTRVCVFVTKRGKIITSVHQWQRELVGERQRERHDAGVHESAKDALAWLVQDGGNRLGRASREAWDLACRVWPSLQGCEVEVIE
jgi:hypothetical protein